jgi:F-type H+-transporting ATPase subunit b
MFDLSNPLFWVIVSFVLFIALLVYVKVPASIAGALDSRADRIRNDLDEARQLREEAQSLLASFERKQAEVAKQADAIVEQAKSDSAASAEAAKAALGETIERKLRSAEDRIKQAETAAVREVRDSAVTVSVAAATDLISKSLKKADKASLIDDSIAEVGKRLH